MYLLQTFSGLFPFIRTLTGITGSETPVAAPAPAPTGSLHTPTSTHSTTPTSTYFSCHIPTGSSSMDGHCLKYQI